MRITWCRAVSWLQAVGTLKGVAKTFAGNLLTPSCHPRCPCHSFFSRKEIKVFDEKIPGFLPYNGVGTKRFKVQMRVSTDYERKTLNDSCRKHA